MLARQILVAAVAAAAITGILSLPAAHRLNGLSLDWLFWLRDAVHGPRHDPAASPTVVIAVDEETYRQPPFRDLPDVLWTPEVARVGRNILDGGAKIIGFDVIYPTSVHEYIPQHDREFLRMLRDASVEQRVLLSKVQHQIKPLGPFRGYIFAVRGSADTAASNVHAVNLSEDDDGVIRRVPLTFEVEGIASSLRRETSFALELAARALGEPPAISAAGAVRLGDYVVPARTAAGMLVNFDGGNPIPTYSMADLYACAEAGRTDYFREQFAGKIVLIGAVLDEEDRKITSRRHITVPEIGGLAERCVIPVPTDFYNPDLVRETIPGVYIHAQAINDLLRREVLIEPNPILVTMLLFFLVFAVGWVTAAQPLERAAIGVGAGIAVWIALAVSGFQNGVALPLLAPLIGASLAYAGVVSYRFIVADRQERFLRQFFSYYLPATVIDSMMADTRRPTLGGEQREVTVFFSDVEGFTALAEGMAPNRLVELLNRYLSLVTDIVEQHHGIVDKYIGDGVVAVFGAPVNDPEHARHAVETALDCQARLSGADGAAILPGRTLVTRIGINTGEVLVGNIGSQRRHNYTVMGDAVNLASRLESANKEYGTRILASEATMRSCGLGIVFREIDRLRVVGRHAPVRVFEPLAASAAVGPEQAALVERFSAALADFRSGRFAEAEVAFRALADSDQPSAVFARRAAAHAGNPPPDWDGITDLTQK